MTDTETDVENPKEVEIGPIWGDYDYEGKAEKYEREHPDIQLNGEWRTTIWCKMSVIKVMKKKPRFSIFQFMINETLDGCHYTGDFETVEASSDPAEFPTESQNGLTCYAHAIATVLHFMSNRLTHKSLKFKEVLDSLITQFGKEGADVEKVLREQCPKFGFGPGSDVPIEKKHAFRYLRAKEPIIATFSLSESRMKEFYLYFNGEHNKVNGTILTRTKLGNDNGKQMGHAVVLVGYREHSPQYPYTFLQFLNSWGESWGYHGSFKIIDENVFNNLKFYRVIKPTHYGM